MTTPIIIYRPLLILQELDGSGGAAVGSPVDVSCDMSSVELGLDAPIITVATFCGKFQVPDDIEESATLEVTVNDDTSGNWAPLVGKFVQAKVFDRTADNVVGGKYRTFETFIPSDPSLYGPTTPGEARVVSFDVPITAPIEWATVAA